MDKLTESIQERVLKAGSYSLKDIRLPLTIYLLRLEKSDDHFPKTTHPVEYFSKNDSGRLQAN